MNQTARQARAMSRRVPPDRVLYIELTEFIMNTDPAVRQSERATDMPNAHAPGAPLELIAAAGKPVKAYDLLDHLRERHGNAAPPTVYRALDFLLEHGFIHKLESINAFVSCHHPAEAHQVPFLICDVCSSAQEVCDERVAELIEAQAKTFGFRPQAQTLEVHGICKECRKA